MKATVSGLVVMETPEQVAGGLVQVVEGMVEQHSL